MEKVKWKSVIGICLGLVLTGATYAQTPSITGNQSKDDRGDYKIIDLSTGEEITVYYDTVSWKTINKTSNLPVDYYIVRYGNSALAPDTIHGVTGLVVNDLLMLNNDGKWTLNEAKVKWDGEELKMKDKYGRKVKWENGTVKIKDWNSKYKSEKGDDTKYKEEWNKVKWKDDVMKVEYGTQKSKTRQ